MKAPSLMTVMTLPRLEPPLEESDIPSKSLWISASERGSEADEAALLMDSGYPDETEALEDGGAMGGRRNVDVRPIV